MSATVSSDMLWYDPYYSLSPLWFISHSRAVMSSSFGMPLFFFTGNSFSPSQVTTAYVLKKAWPEITLQIIPDAGHSSHGLSMTKPLIEVSSIHPSAPFSPSDR
jgi:hypothetical protein